MNSHEPQGEDTKTSIVNEHLPSRRDFLLQSSRTAAGIGIAAMLGNLGTWALSLGADTEPIKVGVLHSLSGTMAISEVSLKDVV
ncbi:MAG TPA: transporter substrate-binding protein, partial [Nitrospira sp.]|nr:transporter substrate-binding protein [Nitrospira sp.]